MTDGPERIDMGNPLTGVVVEYVRADALEAANARIAELEAEAERRDEQIQTMIEASGQTCACGYDYASDVCLGHYPHFTKSLATARAEALEEAAAKAASLLSGDGWEERIAAEIRALKGDENG